MSLQITTLRPGLLVSLHTTLEGNARYTRNEIELDHIDATGARVARWETERTIVDPAEHEAGVKARSDARNAITRVCSQSRHGLLCPNANREDLNLAVRTARQIVNLFNSTARLTEVGLSVIIGEIAQDDVEAVRSINSEISKLIGTMERGVIALDPKTIRDAANKARDLGRMLTDDANDRVKVAIDAARTAARRIVQAGDTAAAEIDQSALAALASARTAFLDLDQNQDTGPVELPQAVGPALDFEPAPDAVKMAPAPAALLFDF